MLATAGIFEFEEFRLDRWGDGLSRRDENGVFVPLSIGARALDDLGVLVERAGELVTKEEIMAAVWRRSVVENANLTVQIAALRRVLDQGRSEGSCIQTVAVRGYRFVAPVTRLEKCAAEPTTVSHRGVGEFLVVGVPPAPQRRSRTRLATVATAVLAGLAAAGIAWWVWPTPSSSPASMPVAASAPPTFVAPRLSIVVLPFADLSEGRGQQYFADGVTDDLTTDLSRLRNVLVISRNTAFTYKDQHVDAKQIGRELGVRYLLEGSVRRSGNEVKINAQLIDAATNTHLWAERFNDDIGNLFSLQNEVTSRIANTLGWELIAAETAHSNDRPDTLDYLLRGRAAIDVHRNFVEAVRLFEHALALDPRSVEAQTHLASALVNRAMGQKSPAAKAADLQRSEELIAQALAASPGDAHAHRTKGKLLRDTRRCEDAIPEFEIALAIDRNYPLALGDLGMCKFLTGGSDQEAIALIKQAIRLSPRDPNMWWWYTRIGFVHLLQERIDEAIVWLEKGKSMKPDAGYAQWCLAAADGFKGDLERARAELAEAKRLWSPHLSVAGFRAKSEWYTPAVRDRWETVIFPGLRAAGLPEE